MKIALDAMGGDHAPLANIDGAIDAVKEWPELDVILVGDEAVLSRELSRRRYPKDRISIKHASELITMDENLTTALRRKKDSSVKRAIEMVSDAKADAAVSAGHSGITMALALILIGKSKGVDRPTVAALMPTYKKPFLLVDAGANVDCTANQLLQFALMADAYSRLVHERPSPRIGLLSIGEEESKGNELTKEAFKLLKSAKINFIGNVEGREIFNGDVDILVCDGFVGNVVLKTSEGLAETTIKMLKREIQGMLTGKLGYLLLKPALKEFKRQTDYEEYGGAPLLGINGTCVICHGRSTKKAIKNAIGLASDFSSKVVYEAISEEIAEYVVTESAVAAG